MNHPVKVAERCADPRHPLDGRLEVGFGKGGTQQESGTFGYQIDELRPMIAESMRLIPRFWLEDVVEHHGEYVDVPPRPIHPKPLQDPHPPLYMACTHDDSLGDAGRPRDRRAGARLRRPRAAWREEPHLPRGVRQA